MKNRILALRLALAALLLGGATALSPLVYAQQQGNAEQDLELTCTASCWWGSCGCAAPSCTCSCTWWGTPKCEVD